MRFEDLPKEIQDWVGSEKFTDSIIAIRNKYGFKTKFTVLPDAVFMLLTKEISPESLGGELMKNFETNDLAIMGPLIDGFKQTALTPIKEPLLKWGVDIDLINLSPAPEGQDEKAPPPLAAPQFPKREAVPGPALKSSKPFIDSSPFIIHTEEEIKTAASQTSRRDLFRPSFYQPGGIAEAESSEPVTARIETEGLSRDSGKPGNPLTARTATPEPRVVHYSDLKTPLDPFGKAVAEPVKEEKKQEVHPDNVINLKDLPK